MAVGTGTSAAPEPLSTKAPGFTNLKRLFKIRGVIIGSVILGIFIFGAIFAPVLSRYDPVEISADAQLEPPSAKYWLGTDQLGRDNFSRLLYGARLSLVVGFVSVAIGGLAGSLLGLMAGYGGGWIDAGISGLIDIMLAFPGLVLALLIIVYLGPGLLNVMIATGIGSTPRWARLVRNSVMSIKESEYVMAARAAGADDSRIMVRHIFINVMGPVIVFSTLGVGGAILTAASLGYLGLGAQPPTPEWGLMLSESRAFIRVSWWTTTFPGLAIMLSVLSINMIGDGLRDVLDPRLRGRT